MMNAFGIKRLLARKLFWKSLISRLYSVGLLFLSRNDVDDLWTRLETGQDCQSYIIARTQAVQVVSACISTILISWWLGRFGRRRMLVVCEGRSQLRDTRYRTLKRIRFVLTFPTFKMDKKERQNVFLLLHTDRHLINSHPTKNPFQSKRKELKKLLFKPTRSNSDFITFKITF